MKPPLLRYRLNTFLLLEFYSDQTCLQCEMVDFQSVIKLTFIVIFTEMRVNTMYIGKRQSISISSYIWETVRKVLLRQSLIEQQ